MGKPAPITQHTDSMLLTAQDMASPGPHAVSTSLFCTLALTQVTHSHPHPHPIASWNAFPHFTSLNQIHSSKVFCIKSPRLWSLILFFLRLLISFAQVSFPDSDLHSLRASPLVQPFLQRPPY